MRGIVKRMFYSAAVMALAGGLLPVACAQANEGASLKSPLKTLVFAPVTIQANPAPSAEIVEGVKATLAVALHQSGRFILLDNASEAAAEPGKVRVGQTASPQIQVHLTIVDAVNNTSQSVSVANVKIKVPFGGNRASGSVQVKKSRLRMLVDFIEIKTGRHLFQAEGVGESTVVGGSAELGHQEGNGGPLDLPNIGVENNGRTQSLLPFGLSNSASIVKWQQFRNSSMGSATQQAAGKAVQKLTAQLDQLPWQAQIADVFHGHISLNAGTMEGVKNGDRFTLWRVKTPTAGIETEEAAEKIGQIEIVKTDTHFSEARLIEGTEVKRGDLVRVAP